MKKPKAPVEDPSIKEQREREQRRAEAARTEETQALLMGDTLRRFRRFGALGGNGSVATIVPTGGGTVARPRFRPGGNPNPGVTVAGAGPRGTGTVNTSMFTSGGFMPNVV